MLRWYKFGMKKTIIFIFAILLILSIVIWQQIHSRYMKNYPMQIELKTIEGFQEGKIIIEENFGEIFLTVGHKYGDAHIHLLKLEGVSKTEALKILNDKKQELVHCPC